MKNMSWGRRIIFLYSGFIVLILFLVYKTTTVKDDLVTKDYYARELQYQEHLDKQKRTYALAEQPTWSVDGKNVSIKFPDEFLGKNLKAQILFYNPAEEKKDFSVECSPDSTGICQVVGDQLAHGVYELKIDWSSGGISYYNEGTINIR